MNNKEKLQRFVIKLIDMTVLKEIYWHILGNYEFLAIPSGTQLAGYVYKAEYSVDFWPSLHYYIFVLYRCRHPVENANSIPMGKEDDFSYYLAIYDHNNGKEIFRDEISRFVVLEDLYEEVQNQMEIQNKIHPIDDLIDQVLNKK